MWTSDYYLYLNLNALIVLDTISTVAQPLFNLSCVNNNGEFLQPLSLHWKCLQNRWKNAHQYQRVHQYVHQSDTTYFISPVTG